MTRYCQTQGIEVWTAVTSPVRRCNALALPWARAAVLMSVQCPTCGSTERQHGSPVRAGNQRDGKPRTHVAASMLVKAKERKRAT